MKIHKKKNNKRIKGCSLGTSTIWLLQSQKERKERIEAKQCLKGQRQNCPNLMKDIKLDSKRHTKPKDLKKEEKHPPLVIW